jgi:hypothetical protein
VPSFDLGLLWCTIPMPPNYVLELEFFIRKRRFKAVLRTRLLVHDDRGKPLSIVRSSWQQQKHPKSARRIAIGRWRRSAESLN